MAIFIQTDSDESMLAAMEVARDMEVGNQEPTLAEATQHFEQQMGRLFQPQDYNTEVLDRMDRGVSPGFASATEATLARATEELEDLGSEALLDFVVKEVEPKQQPAMVFNQETRCDVFNAVNKFNGGIDLNKTTREKAMDDISRQGLSASILLFTTLGFPVED